MLYNSVKIKGLEHCERPLGEIVARKINQWGDTLLEPIRGTYGGRTYTVSVSQEDVAISSIPGNTRKPIFCLDRIRAFVGHLFKKIAHFACRELRDEYAAAINGNKSFFHSKKAPVTLIKAEGRGRCRPSGAEVLGDCCAECCMMICAMCEVINKH